MATPIAIIITIAPLTVAVVSIVVIAALVAIVAVPVAIISAAAVATVIRFAAFLTPVIGLAAVIVMVLYGFTQLVFCFRYAPPAIVVAFSLRTGSARNEKHTAQRSSC